ncbi:MAG: HupE/UreJ family protein [Pseudomonadales bacterium]|nr:HupE/UreJ family protein [Pseudomonadales bacterium]
MSFNKYPLIIAVLILTLVLSLGLSTSLFAHPLAPALIKVDVQPEGRVRVLWKESIAKTANVNLAPVFPQGCKRLNEPSISSVDSGMLYEWDLLCAGSWVGESIVIQGLSAVDATVLVDYGDVGGKRTSVLLTRHQSSFVIPEAVTALKTIEGYTYSGVVHLLSGWDHLLFVFGVFILLYQQRRKMLLAITAFTVGHSVSLLFVGLDLAPALGVWIEILIALSITFLALEILNVNTTKFVFGVKDYPCRLTAFFGLIHGCGFALVLKEMLSNTSDKLLPLVSFNVGIELGQCIMLLFFMGVSILLSKLGRLSWCKVLYEQSVQRVMPFWGYSLGIMSMYWVLFRSADIF